jgi:hypothetical protein
MNFKRSGRRMEAMRLMLLVFLLMTQCGSRAAEPFAWRGYYITFMRTPTLGLEEWKRTIDCIEADRGNVLLLWIAGGFASKKFPVTWKYNTEHANVRRDFVGELIDYAHGKGVKVLLALTPFAYDGVNQFPIEHPELKATQKNGQPASLSGIHCWGYNLCPSKPESQRFMLEYARELFLDFYPNADGVLLESSDYAICFCGQCGQHYFEKEFEFVRTFSEEIWRAKPEATIVVYPHYFSGRQVPGFDVTGARLALDPRWTLFFTPHSAHLDAELVKRARSSIFWDDSPAVGTPARIQAAARQARQAGVNGFVPSLEAFSFRAERAEGGEQYLVGQRVKPFGLGWLRDGAMPFDELLVRVNRAAYREFSRNPELPFETFREQLAREWFGSAKADAIDDLLFLHECFFAGRSWWSASAVVTPPLAREKFQNGSWKSERKTELRSRLQRIKILAERYANSSQPNEKEMHRIATWVLQEWNKPEFASLLKE